jgi:hypothetical protein
MIGETESARPSINLMTATEVGSGGVAAPAHGRTQSRHHAHVLVYRSFPVLALLILPSFLRLWQLDRVGFNSDEAVHSGTAAAMAGNDTLRTMFPIFRAHPLLLQMLLSVWMKGPSDDFATRAVCAMIGVLAPPGGVISYVSGGGGAKLTPVSHRSSTDAYAVGWSYSAQKGSACGAATPPTVDSQVFHYLLVHVDGTTITVTPVDSGGRAFDTQTYPFGPDSMAPSAPGSLTATVKSTKTILNWTAASDNVGVAVYDLYRNSAYLATIRATATTYSDLTAVAGTGNTYRVAARDLDDNTSARLWWWAQVD